MKRIKEQEEYEERISEAGMDVVDQMSSLEFENYLALILSNLGYNVRRSRVTKHYGVDLILDGEERIVVQAIRYNNIVGTKAIHEINSAREYYEAGEAWVVTNNYFTSQAIKLAESTNVELIDRYELVDLILYSKNTSQDISKE